MSATRFVQVGSFRIEFYAKSYRVHGLLSGKVSPVFFSGEDLTTPAVRDRVIQGVREMIELVVDERRAFLDSRKGFTL